MSKKDITKESLAAKRLYEVRSIIKELQAEEKELKQIFLDMSSFDSGEYLVSIIEKERESLDKTSLTKELGSRIKNFMKKTQYKTVNVSPK